MAFKVFVDPGHGGIFTGATGPGGLVEKTVNLAVALKVEQYLTRMGMTVQLSRRTDQTLANTLDADLQARVQAARSFGADAFVSIHCNAASDPSAAGLETWYVNDDTHNVAANATLAQLLQRHLLVTTGRHDRGTMYKQNPHEAFYVIRNVPMPATLVELAFISNPDEEKLLATEWYQEKAALGIAYAIKVFSEIP